MSAPHTLPDGPVTAERSERLFIVAIDEWRSLTTQVWAVDEDDAEAKALSLLECHGAEVFDCFDSGISNVTVMED